MSTPGSTKSATEDSVELGKTTAGETSQNGVVKPDQNNNNPDQKPSTLQTVLLLVSVFLSMFLVAIDRTIISTAIPHITDEFNSLPDAGWYGSVYLLTCCAFQLLFGKFYTFYSVKVILEQIGNVYQLDLPPTIKIHPVFSPDKLQKVSNNPLPGQEDEPPEPIVINGE